MEKNNEMKLEKTMGDKVLSQVGLNNGTTRFIKWSRLETEEKYSFLIKIWTTNDYLEKTFNSDIFNIILTNFFSKFLSHERKIKEFYNIKLEKEKKEL